jgi:hypothetical protein
MAVALFVAAIALTASLARALVFVQDLSECTEAGSTCFYDVQRWFYSRLVSSFVGIDIAILEAQAAGLCKSANLQEDLVKRNFANHLTINEVCMRPSSTGASNSPEELG